VRPREGIEGVDHVGHPDRVSRLINGLIDGHTAARRIPWAPGAGGGGGGAAFAGQQVGWV